MTTEDTFPVLEIDSSENDLRRQIRFPSCRLVFSVVSCLGFVNVYALRVNLSVALVAMVNSSYSHVSTSSHDDCPGRVIPNVTEDDQGGEFNWDNSLQGYILGSFFYGYMVTQLPGGWLAQRFGGKQVFGVGCFLTAVFTLFTPLAAQISPYFLIALRVLEGIGEGVTAPAMHCLLSKWSPPLERSLMTTFIYAGCQFGTLLALPLTGVICNTLGWPWAFYISGASGCIWFIIYEFLVFDSPSSHPRISESEKSYLEKVIGPHQPRDQSIPWFGMLTSIHFWALAVAHFCYNWGFYMLLTSLPKYFEEVLHYRLAANGFLSALPYLVQWFSYVLGGHLADTLIKREILSCTAVRKLMNTLGKACAASCLLAVSFQGCNPITAVVLLVVGSGLGALATSGFMVNHLDLAPQHAGTMMGMTNALATIPGFLAPQVVGWFTESQASAEQWQKVFFLSSGIYTFGALAFLIFASGEKQPWASQRRPDNTENSTAEPTDGNERLQRLQRFNPFHRFNPFNTLQEEERNYVH